MFDVELNYIFNNTTKFYTILFRKSLNSLRQVYTRAYVAYGRFIDTVTFRYHIVFNNKLIDDVEERNCTLDRFLKKNNKEIYIFNNMEDAIKECKKINNDFKKVKIRPKK